MTVRTYLPRATLLVALALLMPSFAHAQRLIHLVVPFGPGAVADALARAISNELGQQLGATVVVENRPGAGGTIGTAAVAKAAPDGNTLLLAAASHTLAGHLYAKLSYDPIKDFAPVAHIGNFGYVIAAPANMGINEIGDYLKLIRARPGEFNYSSAGNGSGTHLAMAYFLAKAGAQMQHIPLKSAGDAVNEVLAGRVQGVAAPLPALIGFRQEPRIKLLAYSGTQRSKLMPELPTATEAGVSDFVVESWNGVLAPAGTPRAEVERLSAAIRKVLTDPAVRERMLRLGVETEPVSLDAFERLIRADWETAGAIVRASGARLE